MKIHLFGASGAGSTTQGLDLSAILGIPYFDTDTYYWEISDPPFTIRRDPEIRNMLIKGDSNKHDHYIIGGSLVNWGEEWKMAFDLAVFLYIPKNVRVKRLEEREKMRYGTIIFTDPERNRLYREYIEWCAGYDTNTAKGRTLAVQESWALQLSCPLLSIKGDLSVMERRQLILSKLTELGF